MGHQLSPLPQIEAIVKGTAAAEAIIAISPSLDVSAPLEVTTGDAPAGGTGISSSKVN